MINTFYSSIFKDPNLANITDGGLDVYANLETESITLDSLERTLIPTGVHVELPKPYCIKTYSVNEYLQYTGDICPEFRVYIPQLLITPKSGLSHKLGLSIVNSPGLLDNGYRGEVFVNIINMDTSPVTISHGMKIGQLVRIDVPRENWIKTDIIDTSTTRGNQGYGSTGIF